MFKINPLRAMTTISAFLYELKSTRKTAGGQTNNKIMRVWFVCQQQRLLVALDLEVTAQTNHTVKKQQRTHGKRATVITRYRAGCIKLFAPVLM